MAASGIKTKRTDMSDHSISIVPKQSRYPDNKRKAGEILDWLVSKDIVKPATSDCILSSDRGYAISEGARKAVVSPGDLPFGLIINGLEIVTERRVFDTGENGLDECICPNCNENIALDDWDLNPWNDEETNNLSCPQCGRETDIHEYTFKPAWGFSDLGFKFWNWPDLTGEFIADFKRKLGCEISIVYQHI